VEMSCLLTPANTMGFDRFDTRLSLKGTLGATYIYGASIALLGIYPLMAGLYRDRLGLGLPEVGWVLGVEQSGCAIGSLLGFWLTPRFRWRTLIVGACIAAFVANVLTAGAGSFVPLVLLRFVSGIGMALTTVVSACVLARSTSPDRAYGAGFFLQCVLAAIGVWLFGEVHRTIGYGAAIGSGAVWFGTAALVGLTVPANLAGSAGNVVAVSNEERRRMRPLLATGGLFGLVLFGTCTNGIWDYLDSIGLAHGLSTSEIDRGIWLGVLGGAAGGLIPMLIGAGGGRIRMIAITTFLLLGNLYCITVSNGPMAFIVNIAVFVSVWNLGIVYYMALTIEHDATGWYTRLMNFAAVVGQAAGPFVASIVVSNGSLGRLVMASTVPAIFALLFVLGVAVAGPLIGNPREGPAPLLNSLLPPPADAPGDE